MVANKTKRRRRWPQGCSAELRGDRKIIVERTGVRMCLIRSIASILCLLCPVAIALCQQPDAARPGWEAPVLNYKLVPEWPKPALGDKGFPAGPWNYWQVPGVTVEQ